ncbi:MAG: hypothetical protein DBX90_03010 [Lentisphaerae bacterium]|nr:MAG: hypothetical protein DBX90_03010 [Lentisphaerota bacterium]
MLNCCRVRRSCGCSRTISRQRYSFASHGGPKPTSSAASPISSPIPASRQLPPSCCFPQRRAVRKGSGSRRNTPRGGFGSGFFCFNRRNFRISSGHNPSQLPVMLNTNPAKHTPERISAGAIHSDSVNSAANTPMQTLPADSTRHSHILSCALSPTIRSRKYRGPSHRFQ